MIEAAYFGGLALALRINIIYMRREDGRIEKLADDTNADDSNANGVNQRQHHRVKDKVKDKARC